MALSLSSKFFPHSSLFFPFLKIKMPDCRDRRRGRSRPPRGGLADDLQKRCDKKGIRLVTDGLRDHLAGIDIGLTFVDYGIAETGTLVLDSSNEDLRLATMISEVHIGVLPKSRLRPDAFALEKELQQNMRTTPNYTAFITGASRTADIERVLALGVHGPLELHILLQEN